MECVYEDMCIYHCIVACTHLGINSTGRRTLTMAAPRLLTSGRLRYEVVLDSCGTSPMEGERY